MLRIRPCAARWIAWPDTARRASARAYPGRLPGQRYGAASETDGQIKKGVGRTRGKVPWAGVFAVRNQVGEEGGSPVRPLNGPNCKGRVAQRPARTPAERRRRRLPCRPLHLVFDVLGGVAHRAARRLDILAHAFDGVAAAEHQRNEKQRREPEQPAELGPVGPHVNLGHVPFPCEVAKLHWKTCASGKRFPGRPGGPDAPSLRTTGAPRRAAAAVV